MKSTRSALLAGAISIALLSPNHPQQTTAAPSGDDLQTLIQAVESTTPLPAAAAPPGGNFFTIQHGEDWPPLPADTVGVPFWDLGGGIYLLDDRNVDWGAIQQEAEAEASLLPPSSSGLSMTTSSLLSGGYAYGMPVFLTNLALSSSAPQPIEVSFSVVGGTNNVPYDILTSSNLTKPVSEWTWLGIGYTSNRYTFSNQPLAQAFYILAKP